MRWRTSGRNEMAFIDITFPSLACEKRTAPLGLPRIATDLAWSRTGDEHLRCRKAGQGYRQLSACLRTSAHVVTTPPDSHENVSGCRIRRDEENFDDMTFEVRRAI